MAITQGEGSTYGSRRPNRSTTPVHKTPEFKESVRRVKERDKQPSVPVQSQTDLQERKDKPISFNVPVPKTASGQYEDAGLRIRRFQERERDFVRNKVARELYDFLGKNPGVQVNTNVKEFIEMETDRRMAERRYRRTPEEVFKQRHAAHIQQRKEREQIEKARQSVIEMLGTPPPGVSKEEYDERVNRETRRLVDIIKQPRYVFLSDGTPYFLSKEDERAELERVLTTEGASKTRKMWSLFKYDLADKVEKVLRFLDEGSQTAKEFITDEGIEGNVVGAVLQLGYNSALLGIEYLKFADTPIFATREKAEALRREAEAAKYTDPARAEKLLEQAQDMERGAALRESYNASLRLAQEAVDRSWARLFGEWREGSDRFRRIRQENPNLNDHQIKALIMQEMKKEKDQAIERAADLRQQAGAAYASGDFEKAIQLIREAQEQDRKATNVDHYGAYTWIREPDRYEKFLQDAAVLELQKGEPLSKEEIRRLKEYHANAFTELGGEVLFDMMNLIPGAVLAKATKLPGRAISKVHKTVATAVPAYGKTVNVMGKPIRWLFRESVRAGAKRTANTVHNTLQRVANAYFTNDDIVKGIDQISDVVLAAKRAETMDDAMAIFENGRQTIKGLNNLTFSDFKKLMDAADIIDPTEWGGKFSDGMTKADSILTEFAERSGKKVDEIVTETARREFALQDMAEEFANTYMKPHRITEGGFLTDDTVSGWIVRTLRELSDESVNEMLNSNWFHDWAKNAKVGDLIKPALKNAANWIENSLAFASSVRDLWATIVLTTPRWPLNNFVDTAFRALVYGGNLFDDLGTLFMSTQRALADELGIAPLQFNNALARRGVAFTEQVPYRLLYGGWKPKFGLFSFIADEYRRLSIAKYGSREASKIKIIENMISGLPDGALKKNLVTLADGLNYRVNIFTALRAMPGAIQDLNTAIEFTFRLRMFHREYFNLLKRLEPQFAERGMEALNPITRSIARQIWKASGGNAARMTAMVDNLLGGAKDAPVAWSLLLPPDMDRILRGMDVHDQALFIGAVQNEIDELVETKLRNGLELKPEDFEKLFDDLEKKMQDEVQMRMSAAHGFRGQDEGIRTDGKVNDIPNEDTVQGSMPIPEETSPRAKQIEDAISRLNKRARRKPVDIHEDFATAVSEYAEVVRVQGDGMRVVKRDGKRIIEVGDNLFKAPLKRNSKFYKAINDTIINILKDTDTDIILHSGFRSVDEYHAVMDEFLKNPEAVLDANERQFLAIVNQMENHPTLRRILEQTAPDTYKGYDKALDEYRAVGEYSDAYGFNTRPDKLFMREAERIRPIPGSHIAATNEAVSAIRQVVNTAVNTSPELADMTREFVARMQVHRQELKQFYVFTYPGPLVQSTRKQTRHAGWDLFYRLSEAEFRKEAEIVRRLDDMLKTDPEAAKQFLQEANDNFGEWFLKENGIELEWDAERQTILNIKVTGLDGKIRNFTARRDIANLQVRFFSPRTQKAIDGMEIMRLAKDEPRKMRRQLMLELRNTFNLNSAQADAWSRVIHNHAEKWAQETGRPIQDYYQRFAFQSLDPETAKGLATEGKTKIVKRGAIRKMEDGTFVFFGLQSSNFESMVRETSVLFFDDLVSLAEHSADAAADLSALKKFLSAKTGKKIRGNQLTQEHIDLLTDTFTTYISTGHGPDISLKKGFGRLRKWLNTTFDAVRDTKLAGEIPDDTYRVLDRLFVESQIMDVPTSNRRAIMMMAEEAGLVVQDEESLLKIINDNLAQNAAPGYTPPKFNSLGEVPKSTAARILGTPDKPLQSKIVNEINEAWEVWKTQRALVGFPEDALTDPDTFKAYLRQRMDEEWDEVAHHYNRLLWEVEQFEDAMMNFHGGKKKLRTVLFPRVHEAQMSNSMRTFIRNQMKMASDYEVVRRAMREWKEYLMNQAKQGNPVSILTKEDQAALKAWAYGEGSKAKSELVTAILDGNDEIEGAIALVNKRMLDYENVNVFDQFMKNFFPFWMFPSRSLPFWMETLATHPQLIAAYEKMQRLSRSQRYQAGAVTSSGRPLPSLDGYIKIPGTDLWFNPLAPLSFRYALDIVKSKDDVMYAAQSDNDDVSPLTYLVTEMMATGQIYGFSMAPWSVAFLKDRFNISDDIIPRFPVAPEIPLIPRWWVEDLIHKAEKVNFFGWDLQGLLDTTYPQVPWHDYLVERRILENALQQIQSPELTQAQKDRIMHDVQIAIQYKRNDLWQQTYREVTSEEATRAQASFFTGLYVKNFGDGEADLLALRNEINLLKSALNNEFQTDLFDLPANWEAGWQNYLGELDTHEGWLHRLYVDIGWVRNEEGLLVRDPEERRHWLAKKIEMDENQQIYYEKAGQAMRNLQAELHALPVGADWKLIGAAYDRYAAEMEKLESLRMFERVYGTNKPVEMIQRDIARDWFRYLKSTKPQWDAENGEDYETYQQRVAEWETNLPQIGRVMMRHFAMRSDLRATLDALHDDQRFDVPRFFQDLTAMSTKEGLDQWDRENDDIFDALNKAWKDIYWDDYWNSIIGKKGYDADLAEDQFYQRHPEPPGVEELYSWIIAYYGPGKFTKEEVARYVEGTESLTIEQRQLQRADDPEDYQMRQNIWNFLSWAGPGSANRKVLETAFKNAGGNPEWMTTWYQENGQAFKTQPEKLQQFHDTLQQAVKDLGLKPPGRAELVRYARAQEENDRFRQWVVEELGNDFFDYEDEFGKPQQGVLSYYGQLSTTAEKKQFRQAFPEDYARIQKYYQMKEIFGQEHPVWNDYYGFDAEPTVKLPVDPETGSTLVSPSARSRRRGRRQTGESQSDFRSQPTQPLTRFESLPYSERMPQFYISDRTSNFISPGLYNLVGAKMGWEIANLFSSGRPISSAGVSFLRSIASRYPAYRNEIERILARS